MIHILTGIPTYYAVLSKLCIKCKIATDSPEDAKWQARHAPNCPKQFDGTAGAMEVDCAKILWGKLAEKHTLQSGIEGGGNKRGGWKKSQSK